MKQMEPLKKLLKLPPSAGLFNTILSKLTKLKSKASQAEGLALVESALSQWPDEYKHCGMDSYWPTFPKGTPPPHAQLVRQLTAFEVAPNKLKTIASQPQLSSLQLLTIRSAKKPYLAKDLAPLLTSPHLAELQELQLFQCGLDALSVEAFLDADLPRLKRLHLGYNHIDGDALRLLIRSPLCAQLEELRLTINPLEAESIEALAEASLPQLRHLSLDSNPLGARAAEVLARLPLVDELRELSLSSCDLNDQSIHILALSPRMAKLEYLNLSHNKIGDEAARSIASSEHLGALQELHLNSTALTAPGAAALADLSQLPSLRSLHLLYTQLGNQAAEAFARSPYSAQLEELDLGGCDLTHEGIAALASSPYVPVKTCRDLITPLDKAALREVAKHLGIKGRSKLKMEALLETIIEHSEEQRTQLDETQRRQDLEQLQDHEITSEDNMSTLRTLLSQEPSVAVFQEIVQLFTYNMAPEIRDLSTKYALEHLTTWPPETRQVGLKALWEDIDYGPLAEHHVLVKSLVVDHSALNGEEARLLAESPLLQHISILDLSQPFLYQESVEALVASPAIENLISLTISKRGGARFDISGTELAEALNAKHLRGLRHLNVSHNEYFEEDLVTLAQSPYMQSLEHLELESLIAPQESAMLAFLNELPLAKLKRLNLRRDQLGPEAARTIAGCEALQHLESLILSNNAIGEEGASALAQSAWLTGLKELQLEGCGIGDQGARAIADSPNLQELVRLNLGHNSLGLDGLEAIVTAPFAESLEELHIYGNPIGDDGLAVLLEASLPRLQTLGLFHCYLSDEAWAALAGSALLAQIKALYMPPGQLASGARMIMGMAPCLARKLRTPLLAALTQSQLKSLAAEHKLKGRSKMNKEALVEALLALPGPACSKEPS